MKMTPQVATSLIAERRFSGTLSAGETIHLWLRPVTATSPSRIQLCGPDFLSVELSGPPSDDFQMVTDVARLCGDYEFTWDESESVVSLCYAFHPQTVLESGIRLLYSSPRTAAGHRRYRMHFSPPFGWMNDPNGLIEIGGLTHFFYQHYPHLPRWNTMHWGHAISHNLVDWIDLPVFLHPRADMLASNLKTGGAFSGSAIPDGKGGLVIFHTEREDGRQPEQEWQMMATSSDLISASPSSAVITERPNLPNFGNDLRDPFVFKGPDGLWKMALGGADQDAALVLLYETLDPTGKSGWNFLGVLHREPLARAVPAECPCVMALDGEGEGLFALIFGLIGHQTPINGRLNPSFALIGKFDGRHFEECARRELDFIGDFYAFQGFVYHSRPVGFAWAANWANFGRGHDFLSSATFARRLVWENGELKMPPVETVVSLRLAKLSESASALEKGMAIPDGMAEISILLRAEGNFELVFDHPEGALALRYDGGHLHFSSPQTRTRIRNVQHGWETRAPREINIYVDVGVLEIFLDGGRLCGTKRIDSDAAISSVQFIASSDMISAVQVWKLRPRIGK